MLIYCNYKLRKWLNEKKKNRNLFIYSWIFIIIFMKPTILFILHMPPPVHGASMMGKYIHDSEVVNGAFDCHYINLTTAKNLADIGKVGLRKLVQFVELLNRIRKEVKRLKPQLVYVTPNACGGAFYKDFVVVQLLKAMGCKVVAALP